MGKLSICRTALVAAALSTTAVAVARADSTMMFGFRPVAVAGVAFSGLQLDYAVKDNVSYASLRCIARAEAARSERVTIDFFLYGEPNQRAFAAAQSQRGIPVSDAFDSYCGAAAWPFADPHRAIGGVRMRVTNLNTGEVAEVPLEPATMAAMQGSARSGGGRSVEAPAPMAPPPYMAPPQAFMPPPPPPPYMGPPQFMAPPPYMPPPPPRTGAASGSASAPSAATVVAPAPTKSDVQRKTAQTSEQRAGASDRSEQADAAEATSERVVKRHRHRARQAHHRAHRAHRHRSRHKRHHHRRWRWKKVYY